MKEIDFAIERGFRVFANELKYFNFNMIQVKINKNKLIDGHYTFQLLNKDKQSVYSKSIYIDSIKKRIITPNSHEDPLVETDDSYMICFQLWEDELINISDEFYEIVLINKQNENILNNAIIENIKELFTPPLKKISHLKEKYKIYSDKDCVFRLHLGYENGQYEEKEFVLKKDEEFNFYEYLRNPYVGLQCSYENEIPEIEEKHIVIGQKAMTLSADYIDEEKNIYKPLLPFNTAYQVLYYAKETIDNTEYAFKKKESWIKISSLDELIEFYKNKELNFFETSIDFVENQYRENLTYGLNKLVSFQKNGKLHIDLDVCSKCENNSKCVQIVPSGLSPLLFKKNILLESEKECNIYQLIETKKQY